MKKTKTIEEVLNEDIPGSEDIPEIDDEFSGTFTGEVMMTEDGKLFPITMNYVSKSRIVEGDELKLRITRDGEFIYKQIKLVARRRFIGRFIGGGTVIEPKTGNAYRVCTSSVAYYRLEIGDLVTLIVPAEGNAMWGAVDNVVQRGS